MNEEIQELAIKLGLLPEGELPKYPVEKFIDYPELADSLTAFHDAAVAKGRSEAVPKGWKVVPIDITESMQIEGGRAVRIDTTAINKLHTANKVWHAMLNAAPPAPLSASKEPVEGGQDR